MNRGHQSTEQGYSLMETIVSMMVFLLVLVAVYMVLESNQTIYARGEGRVDVQQSTRTAMDQITTLLRNAGYFPENFAVPAPPIPLNNPIQLATDSALAIYSDADGTGTSNVFLFCWNEGPDPSRPARNLQYIRWKRSPFGDPAAYTCDQGMVAGQAGGIGLTFAYFDANSNPIIPPLDGDAVGGVAPFTQRSAVRRVVVTLSATENVAGHQPQIFTLTSNVRLRNLN